MRRSQPYIPALVACLIMLVVSPSSSSAQELDGIPEHVVKAALKPNSSVIYSGVMRKQLMPMGDAAAIAVTRVLDGERPQAETVDRVLLIIELSFDSPEAIANQVDQQPKTGLLVLTSLDQQHLTVGQRSHLVQLTKKLKSLTFDSDHDRP